MGRRRPKRMVLHLPRPVARMGVFHGCAYLQGALRSGPAEWAGGILLLGAGRRRPGDLEAASAAALTQKGKSWTRQATTEGDEPKPIPFIQQRLPAGLEVVCHADHRRVNVVPLVGGELRHAEGGHLGNDGAKLRANVDA